MTAEEEFVEFAGAVSARLQGMAFLLCGDWHTAEDLVQATLVKVFVSWRRIRRQETAHAYATRTLVNTYLAHKRLRRTGEIPTSELPERAAELPALETRMVVLAALATLPPRGRAVVVLRYWADLSVDQVAAVLGCSPGAVKSQSARALGKLRGVLGDATTNPALTAARRKHEMRQGMPGMDETSLRRLLDSALAGRPPMGPVAHNALRAGRKRRRRRRIQGAAGGAAAAAIIAAAIPATIGIVGHTPGPAAGHRPAGLAGAPKFFAGVTPVGQQAHPATVVNIYRSATGRVAGSIRPPKPYRDFVAVSRLGGDRTYVAAAITRFSAAACTSHLFQFSIDGRGHPSGLTPLSVPEVTTGRMEELVSSADGKELAFTASGCAPGLEIGLINLATQKTTTWIIPHHNHIPVGYGSLSLTADGTLLGFLDGPASGDGPTNAYVFPPIRRLARSCGTPGRCGACPPAFSGWSSATTVHRRTWRRVLARRRSASQRVQHHHRPAGPAGRPAEPPRPRLYGVLRHHGRGR